MVVENRAGGDGSVAARALIAAAPADGYTVMVTDSAMLSVNPVFLSQLSYNPQKDFVPVALLAPHADVPRRAFGRAGHDAARVHRIREGAAGTAQLRLRRVSAARIT